MSYNLVIVESPAKAKTIEKYLGADFHVLASYGHVRDLIPKEGAVDTEHDFAMKYELIDRNARHVQEISKHAKKADAIYLAPDPDREGEAIAWHLLEILKKKKLLKDKPVHRVVFHEVTKKAIQEAVNNPREISMDMVDAQQTRRALDYLVGFTLSPLLWRKIRRGLSAGRVQSPALRLIVERELEIEKFDRQEYWSIEAKVESEEKPFSAKLTELKGEKLKQFSLVNEQQSSDAKQSLESAAAGSLTVAKVDKKKRKRNPSPPFITSTLQQEASRKLGFTTRRTMTVAQQLYEGMDIGGETVGLITYMRTDSVNLAQEALEEIRAFIQQKFGADNVPKEPRAFKTKSKNAQEAHEAIRPTSATREPSALKSALSADQYKLYNLIWKRAISCQMVHATINTVSADLSCGEGNTFRATGSTIANAGFMAVYLEGRDDQKDKDDDQETLLPELKVGQVLQLNEIIPAQHFTEPPPRFGEASLVKSLEEFGIGRPSTYASIISTLQARDYVKLEKKRFYPTDVGRIVNKFLTEHFTKYVDYNFTARLEDDLDAISRGEKQWVPLMKEFWGPFKALVVEKDESVQRKDVTHEAIEDKCPDCGGPLSIRLGRNGRFIGCDSYPDCKYTRNLDENGEIEEPEIIEDRKCPKCESALIIKRGRYGKFIGCTGYPDCRHIEPLEKPVDTKVLCPECSQANLLKRKSRNGKIFYSCANYPKCKYAIWNEPLAEICPDCNWPILSIKTTKRRGTEKVCPQKECKFSEPYEVDEPSSDD
ncbi:MAG: type I DNA topoisomerase [Gammaproteobacteria bacterium]|nr:MAG: type I DNA topoisomerase [Gammaproteobacteria bacterium]